MEVYLCRQKSMDVNMVAPLRGKIHHGVNVIFVTVDAARG